MSFPVRKLEKKEIPERLMEIPEPPKHLYIRGEMWNPEHKLLCVVGSRAFTPYGKQAIEKLFQGLANQPITIVSGLAMGIDALAHKTAMDVGLQTIAIPGSGLNDDILYPVVNRKLATEILEKGGCLLSEFEPDAKSMIHFFPQRNRIMAGLCDAVLIIEAEIKSGTLITARLATEYNRDVMTIPGSIFSATSEGPHMLLKLGATPIRTSADILDALHIAHLEGENIKEKVYKDLSKEEKEIIDALASPLPKEELIMKLSLPTSDIQGILMMLEIKGLIKEEFGEIRRL
jgi:DNA processing protein